MAFARRKLTSDRLSLEERSIVNQLQEIEERSKRGNVRAIELLLIVERSQIFRKLGYSTVKKFCIGELNYSATTADNRVKAMRLCSTHPPVVSMLRSGRITPAVASLLGRVATPKNVMRLTNLAMQAESTKQVESLVAAEQIKGLTQKFVASGAPTIRRLSRLEKWIKTNAVPPLEKAKHLLFVSQEWVRDHPNRSAEDLVEYLKEYCDGR